MAPDLVGSRRKDRGDRGDRKAPRAKRAKGESESTGQDWEAKSAALKVAVRFFLEWDDERGVADESEVNDAVVRFRLEYDRSNDALSREAAELFHEIVQQCVDRMPELDKMIIERLSATVAEGFSHASLSVMRVMANEFKTCTAGVPVKLKEIGRRLAQSFCGDSSNEVAQHLEAFDPSGRSAQLALAPLPGMHNPAMPHHGMRPPMMQGMPPGFMPQYGYTGMPHYGMPWGFGMMGMPGFRSGRRGSDSDSSSDTRERRKRKKKKDKKKRKKKKKETASSVRSRSASPVEQQDPVAAEAARIEHIKSIWDGAKKALPPGAPMPSPAELVEILGQLSVQLPDGFVEYVTEMSRAEAEAASAADSCPPKEPGPDPSSNGPSGDGSGNAPGEGDAGQLAPEHQAEAPAKAPSDGTGWSSVTDVRSLQATVFRRIKTMDAATQTVSKPEKEPGVTQHKRRHKLSLFAMGCFPRFVPAGDAAIPPPLPESDPEDVAGASPVSQDEAEGPQAEPFVVPLVAGLPPEAVAIPSAEVAGSKPPPQLPLLSDLPVPSLPPPPPPIQAQFSGAQAVSDNTLGTAVDMGDSVESIGEGGGMDDGEWLSAVFGAVEMDETMEGGRVG